MTSASTDPLGFVVLARRPNPNGGHTLEPVSAVFNGPKALEQAQNVYESRMAHEKRGLKLWPDMIPVEYVIGEIRPT